MTFYEAALRVLEAEGRPLHFSEITEKSIQQNLLSHVGKTPEQTMLSRLAAMARRTRDRRVIVTAKDTFALVDWQLREDPEALAETGVPERHPEEDLPPLRPAERHPDPRGDNVRAFGRVERDRKPRRAEEGGRRRRFPPVSEVVFEILSGAAQGMKAEQIVAAARERELAGDDVGPDQVLTALLEDNQKRIDAGRRPQFALEPGSGLIVLERADEPTEVAPQELQAAFAAALGIAMEGGRPVLPRGAPGAEEDKEPSANHAAKVAVKDARKAVARALRQRLAELDGGTFEKAVVKMLHGVGFRELKVAKRSKDGPLLTARRREGSVELRFAVRMLRGNPAIERRMVQELRRDLGHYTAQVGLLVSPGEVRGDGRTEAQAAGGLVMLWCADALGEKFIEARAGVSVVQIELFELDERFFDVARIDAAEAARRREERHRVRQEREAAEETPEPAEAAPMVAGAAGESAAEEPELEGEDGEGEEGDEGEEGPQAQAGAPGAEGQAPAGADRKRRRRRRRGRRGRGNRPEGAPGQPASGQAAGTTASGEDAGASAAPPSVPPPAPEAASPPPAPEAASPPPAPEAASPPPAPEPAPPPPADPGGEPTQG